MAHIGHRLAELGFALGKKAGDGPTQQNLDAVDDHCTHRGSRLTDTALAGVAVDEPAYVADVPQIIHSPGQRQSGQRQSRTAGQGLLEFTITQQPGVHGDQPAAASDNTKSLAFKFAARASTGSTAQRGPSCWRRASHTATALPNTNPAGMSP